jgi:exosortase K
VTGNRNILFYLIAAAFFILLKFAYVHANTSHLSFLLAPTNKMVTALTGFHSILKPDNGYYYKQLNIVIDKSCSGFNFWLLSFLMLFFLIVKYFVKMLHKIYAFILSLIIAYAFTILVNSSRIFASIVIQNINLPVVQQHQAMIHQITGIITNLAFLMTIYIIAEKILNKRFKHEKCT